MSEANADSKKGKTGATCPICGAAAVKAHHPFCSRRCGDLDLGRWLRGHYAIPAEEAPSPPPDDDEDA